MYDFITTLRLQRGAEHLHVLGSRAIAEFLAAITEAHGRVGPVIDLLDEFRRLTPEAVRMAGGNRFPPTLQEVPR